MKLLVPLEFHMMSRKKDFFFFFLNASIYLKCEESRKDLIEIVHLFNKLIIRIVGIIEMY